MKKAVRLLIVIGVTAATGLSGPAQQLGDHTLYMVGQSHIDVAWRWQWEETIGVARDTFGQALQLMQDYPDFRYSQSQAVLYAAMEEHYPELFARIKEAVAAGRWNIVGGMWVEPDLNLPGGEALVRQCLYGQRYFREKFGVEARIGWGADNFGTCWTLPQILKQSHLDTFAFTRCGPPHALFLWQGPDGSQLFAYNVRAIYDQLEALVDTQADLSQIAPALNAVVQKVGSRAIAVPFGVGDHGGGPTRRDIDMFHALGQLPGMPRVRLATAEEAFAAMKQAARDLPVWRDELNYTFQGCYTSQGEMKRRNRRCENLLTDAEKFAVMARLTGGFDYPRSALLRAWRGVLFNQFHDILPGSSIGPVYEDATDLYRDVEAAGQRILDGALGTLCARATTQGEGEAVVVFNPLPWRRTDLVEVTLDYEQVPQGLVVRDAAGQRWAAQVASSRRIYERFERCQVIFAARDVPPLGFKVFWIEPTQAALPGGVSAGQYWLQSPRLRVEVDPTTGHVISCRDLALDWEIIPRGAHANVLRLLGDDSGDHTAWEIKYTGQVAELAQPTHLRVVESGPVRATIAVGYFRNGSVYEQRISLYQDIPRVDFTTTVDWREYHTALKACFPLALTSESFTREIPFGNIVHACNGDEVPAQKWVDLSQPERGVSLLNDSRHGHSVVGSEMSITLLRSPTDPDPAADLGRHVIRYSLYPHAGGWRQALTQRRAEEFNAPLLARREAKHEGPLGAHYTLLAIEPDNLCLAALKLCEDSEDVIVRIWEAHGSGAPARISFAPKPLAAVQTDLLEDETGAATVADNSVAVEVGPYQIRTLKVRFQ